MAYDKEGITDETTKFAGSDMKKGKAEGRMVYFEPNDLVFTNQNGSTLSYDELCDNTVFGNEELTMSVDLQVIIPDRYKSSKDGERTYKYNIVNGDDMAAWQSLMSGNPIEVEGVIYNELTTEYTTASYQEIRRTGRGGIETLGIKSINISFSTNFYPIVNVKFVDTRGHALMMPCDEEYINHVNKKKADGFGSFYKSLFHMPYPRFLLTVKGYYGRAVTFELTVEKFSAEMDDDSGDMLIDIQFLGCVYGLYADLAFNMLMVAPYLDYNNNTKKTPLKLNNRWKNEDFVYCGNDGKSNGSHIATYLDFLHTYGNLSGKLKEIQTPESKELTKQINALEKIIGETERMIEQTKFLLTNITNLSNLHVIGDAHDYTIFYLLTIPNENEKYILNKDVVENYKKSISKYTEFWKDALGSLSGIDEIRNEKSLEGFSFDDMVIESEVKLRQFEYFESVEEFEKKYGYNNAFTKEAVSSIVAAMNTHENIRHNRKYFTVTLGNVMKFFELAKEYLNKKLMEKQEERHDSIESDMIKVFGFSPTIRNTFRQLFAHIDCFMDSFYGLLDDIDTDISQGKRKAGDLFRSTSSDIKDDFSFDRDVSPFPAVYQYDDGRNTVMYPGEDPHLMNIREVKFVDDIINTLFKANNHIIQAPESSGDEDEEQVSGLYKLLSDMENATETQTPQNKNTKKPEVFPYVPSIPIDYCLNEPLYKTVCSTVNDIMYIFKLRLKYCLSRYAKNSTELTDAIIKREVSLAAESSKNNITLKNVFGSYSNPRDSFNQYLLKFDANKVCEKEEFNNKVLNDLCKNNKTDVARGATIFYDFGNPKESTSIFKQGYYPAIEYQITKPGENFNPLSFVKKYTEGGYKAGNFTIKNGVAKYKDKSLILFDVKNNHAKLITETGELRDEYKNMTIAKSCNHTVCFDEIINRAKNEEINYRDYFVAPVYKNNGQNIRNGFCMLAKHYLGDTPDKNDEILKGNYPGYGKYTILELYHIISDISYDSTLVKKDYPVIDKILNEFESTNEAKDYWKSFYTENQEIMLFLDYNSEHISKMLIHSNTVKNERRVKFMTLTVDIFSMNGYHIHKGVKYDEEKVIKNFLEQYLRKMAAIYKINLQK